MAYDEKVEYPPGTIGDRINNYFEACSKEETLSMYVDELFNSFIFTYEVGSLNSEEYDYYISYEEYLVLGNTPLNAIIRLKNNINIVEMYWIEYYATFNENNEIILEDISPCIYTEIFKKYFPVEEFPELWI